MLIEVIGTSYHNKGAELMLHAIAAQRDGALRGHTLAVQYGRMQPETVQSLGLTLLPRGVRSMLARAKAFGRGFASPREVGAVLDASGFAYSDQWGSQPALASAALFRERRGNGCPIVLMPQALGPFRDPTLRTAFAKMAEMAHLIFARDAESLGHATDAGADPAKLRVSPDFTMTLGGGSVPNGRVVIVPNVRMVDKTGGGAQYVALIAGLVRHLAAGGIEPLFVLHTAREDRPVVEQVEAALGRRVETVQEPDVLRLKQLLHGARLVIASRYHAIISSLSAGVPCIATGWSHKYAMLYDDFQCPDLLLRDLEDVPSARALVDALLDEGVRTERSAALRTRAAELQQSVDRMWAEVGGLLRR